MLGPGPCPGPQDRVEACPRKGVVDALPRLGKARAHQRAKCVEPSRRPVEGLWT
jgi:hypothetical protein